MRRSRPIRRTPWTRIRSVPSGTRISLWTTAAVPTSYRSSNPGGSVSSFLTVTSATMRSPFATSSISLIERSCPIASGVIDCGKTTVSLSGRTGRVEGTSISLSSIVISGCSSLIPAPAPAKPAPQLLVRLRRAYVSCTPPLEDDRDAADARPGRERHHDREQPAVVARLGAIGVDVLRQGDPPLEGAVVDLHLPVRDAAVERAAPARAG